MNKGDIIEYVSRERLVETLTEHIAHRSLGGDLFDLAQIVYEILLRSDADRLRDLYENGQMRFYIARIIINQLRSRNSPFYRKIRYFADVTEDIGGRDYEER